MGTNWLSYVFPPLLLLFVYLKTKRRSPISVIDGPVVQASFVLGNFTEYYHFGVGAYEFKWQEKYGALYRIKALFGEDRLVVTDPKALQYIYQTAATQWMKPEVRREFGRIYLGKGIAWAQGDDHKRHRKILSPAFTSIRTQSMIPVFFSTAERMCQQWQQKLSGNALSVKVEITDSLSRAALDAIGEVGFNYKFNSLERKDDPLAKAYESVLVSTFGLPSKGKIFAQHLLGYLPITVLKTMARLPSRSLAGLKNVAREGDIVAAQLLNEKKRSLALEDDDSEKGDVLDLIVKANLSERPESQLSDEELSAQARTIMVAGHETTANSIAFILYEIARNESVQEKLREEVLSIKASSQAHLSVNDFEGMHYTKAVIKEGLRLHPVVYGPFLQPAKDDVIPLSKPIRTLDGRMIKEVPIAKGQIVHISVAGYNRLKDLWGETAHEFRPERWLEPNEECRDGSGSPFGVYSNLGNFVSGAQSCLGWKFAVYEIQAYLIQILSCFKLSYPEGSPRVIRATSGVMAPVLEGEVEKGKRLVLEISAL